MKATSHECFPYSDNVLKPQLPFLRNPKKRCKSNLFINLDTFFRKLLGIFVFGFKMAVVFEAYCEGALYYFKAVLRGVYVPVIEVSPFLWEIATQDKSSQDNLCLPMSIAKKYSQPYWEASSACAYLNFARSMIAAGISGFCALVFFIFKGASLKGKHHISGNQVVSPRRIAFPLKFLCKIFIKCDLKQ